MAKKTIAVIGGGAAALAFCSFIDSQKYTVTLYEKNHAVGRKFLVAGKGGFNLTHNESLDSFYKKYTPSSFLEKALNDFSNQDFRAFLLEIGIPTFVGSSNRIYPKEGIKPVEVLKALLKHLEKNKINLITKTNWINWKSNGKLQFADGAVLSSDITVFSLGGGSWKITGSDGGWLPIFKNKGIHTVPFSPSNCGLKVDWTNQFIKQNEGKPFKNIAISCNGKTQLGEVVITKLGIEGNGIYGLSPQIRTNLQNNKKAVVYIDFKPTLSEEEVTNKLNESNYSAISDRVRNDLKITKAQVHLLKSLLTKEAYTHTPTLARYIKSYPLEITGFAPIDEAISTVGGISLSAIGSNYELNKMPNHFCIGEMLDYDAPTGGYLLQSCFSMGYQLAKHLNSKG